MTRVVATPPTDPRHALAAYQAGATRLAEALYSIETDAEFELLDDKGAFRGQSATLAADARTRVDNLWLHYPLLKDALDRLQSALGVGDHVERGRLLGPHAVVLPTGSTTSIAGLLTGLERDLEQATSVARRLGSAWRTLLPHAERLGATLARLSDLAEGVGLADDRDLATARRLVGQVSENAATDPLGVDPTPAGQAIERARDRIEQQVRLRDGLPDALAAARAQLEDLAALAVEGQEALAATRAKVARPTGLLRPLHEATLDDGDRALSPWLRRLEKLAEAGEWRPAATGLERWRTVADGWEANARKIVEANRAPVRRRNELRGLLDGYRAKAEAQGRSEDPALADLHRQARSLLHTAPADIEASDAVVREYGRAVNQPPGTPP
ncbi:MAG: hypothetical protein ACRD29_03250 [Acidimicrobiales bacterium]